MRGHDIVVIGTSAGGVMALQELFRGLPVDFPAAVFVVMHVAPHLPSALPKILVNAGRLPAIAVEKNSRFRPGRVYVAPPDHHLILTKTEAQLHRGPRENWHRPSVDVLFRSAAQALGPRVVGVVLTGFLDDGTAGLAAIHRRGGITVVQDPKDALFPDMPMNAVQNVKVDHCVTVARMADTLIRAVQQAPRRDLGPDVSKEAAMEATIAKMNMNGRTAVEKIGKPSTFTCPECQGPLWELTDSGLLRYRCQVGHAFNAESMLTAQQDVVERALWVALGAMQSRVALWRRIADRMRSPHLAELVKFYRTKEAQARRDMEELREILTRDGASTRVRDQRGGSRRPDAGASAASAARTPQARRTRRPGRSPRTSATGA